METPSDDRRVRVEVREIVARLGRAREPFGDDDDLFARGVLRSMNVLELVNELEDRWGVSVEQRDLAAGRLRSIDGVVALVAARAPGRAA